MKSQSLNQMDLIHLAECLSKEQASSEVIRQAVADFLRDHNMTANDLTPEGRPLIVHAMRYSRNAPLVKALLECDGNLHWRDASGNTLMHYAVYAASDEKHTSHDRFHLSGFTPCMIELLLEKGLTWDERNTAGETPLFAMWWPVEVPSTKFLDVHLHYQIMPHIKKMLQWLSKNSHNMFSKNNAGNSFLCCTHVDLYAEQHPEYMQLEDVLRPYKDQEQAQTLTQAVEHISAVNKQRKI